MSAPTKAKPAYRFDVFISYADEDRSWVQNWLVPRLEKAKLRVCFDYNYDIGAPKLENIERAIGSSRHTLLILTPAWNDSDWKNFESLLVQSSDPTGHHQRTLPLLLTACDPPTYLSLLTAADFTQPGEWELQLQRVIRAIQDVRYLPEIGLPLFLLSPIADRLLAAMPTDTLPSIETLPPGSRMKHWSNAQFVGRDDDFKALAKALKHVGRGHPVVISTGIGGMGKTQLAIEFVHRYGCYFAGGVFWLNCSDANNIPSEIALCGGPEGMNLPGFDRLKLEDQRALVIQEWQKPIPRLLVLDNCEEEKLLTNLDNRPITGGSRLLVTSRRQKWNLRLGAVELALEVLSESESVALLRKFRPDIPAGDQVFAQIATELGNLPLALELAGKYLLNYERITPSKYLNELHSSALLGHRSLDDNKDTRGVKNTFILSLRQVEIDPLAKALLLRVARFAWGERIPGDLLRATLELDEDDLQIDDALNLLVSLGFLKKESDQTFRMHRLLAAFAREQDLDAEAQTAVERVVIAEAQRLNDTETPASLRPIGVHLQFIADEARQRTDQLAASLYYELNRYLTMLGLYDEAQNYCERALAISKDLFGLDSLSTARIMNGLGVVLLRQGKHSEARSLFEGALVIEQAQVQDYSDIEPELNQLVALLALSHNIDADQPLRKRALSLREHILDFQHPFYERIQTILQQIEVYIDIAKALDNLGILLDQQGQYSEAQPFYERAIALRKLLLGAKHPHTFRTQTNLAVCYHIQKRYDEAKPLYHDVLSLSEQIRPNHPDTATNYQNLGELYADIHDYASARQYYERALAIREEVLGSDHVDTAYTLHHFGRCLRILGESQRAAEYLRSASKIRTKKLGRDHRDTLASVQELQSVDPQHIHE